MDPSVAQAPDPLASQSPARKNILLLLFCVAQFLDVFSTSSLFSAIPAISNAVGLNNSQSVWLNSAYQLTFASFLLVSGRMADIYNPKYIFLAGAGPLGAFALGAGFVRNKVAIIILRALSGCAASLTIPSSLRLLVHMFPDPADQARAVSFFALSGAIGNVLGVVIGALFVSFASWPWVFWFISIMAFLVFFSCAVLIPQLPRQTGKGTARNLDAIGVSTLTLSVLLFIFALTSGSVDGWGKAEVIVTLVLAVILFVAFFIWEARIPEDKAALPPKMWFYPNFGLLIAIALIPYTWWSSVYLLFAWLWQEVYGWSAIISGLHFLPIGLFVFPTMGIVGGFQQKVKPNLLLLGALILMFIGTILLPFADRPSRYFPLVFPAFCIGTAGTIITFTTVNIALFAVTPPHLAGTVGAIFNCALQLSTAVGSAAITSIQTSVQESHGGPTGYQGRAAGFWFLTACVAIETVALVVFWKNPPQAVSKEPEEKTDGTVDQVNDGAEKKAVEAEGGSTPSGSDSRSVNNNGRA
ncbi:MFS general substrate transporter [Pluteus cervinus]|uniref:MFS general substrate transporter n=1 Tax=Pluteus cervinus TaxID=181527 RepID=A0ACD3A7I6_9AGAR|nr:MFS general substrate transporter [Pluteus cervinus]